jgi:hypothetical protein
MRLTVKQAVKAEASLLILWPGCLDEAQNVEVDSPGQ